LVYEILIKIKKLKKIIKFFKVFLSANFLQLTINAFDSSWRIKQCHEEWKTK